MTQNRWAFRSIDVEANGKAIEAIEKQIPKKPNTRYFEDFGDTCAYCPTCGKAFGELHPQKGLLIRQMIFAEQAHCIECGQAIDMSEVEDETN